MLRSHRTLLRVLLYATTCSFFYSQSTLAENDEPAPFCSVPSFDDTAYIKYIHDGDTLRLKDGRKIRLIGINTPELARDNKPAEPYALAAKEALKTLLKKNQSIALIYGEDRKDRYGRTLAHVFLDDGQNVQATLLKQGYASAIMLPPNIRFSACYLEMESIARCKHKGIWQKGNILAAKDLNKKSNGFHLVKGKVKSIEMNNKGIWLNIDDRLTIGIRPDDRDLFNRDTINSWRNQSIIIRGWLNKSNKENPFYIRVRDPSSIQLSSAFSCT